MHWQNLIGLDQAVGRFVVLADRFRFESEKRSFEMRFDAIVAIKAGDIMLTIQTAQGKRYFSRDTFAVPAPALAAELQSTGWRDGQGLSGRPSIPPPPTPAPGAARGGTRRGPPAGEPARSHQQPARIGGIEIDRRFLGTEKAVVQRLPARPRRPREAPPRQAA